MRLALAIVVACLLAACGLGGPSGGDRAFLGGSALRSAQAALDAQAILQGMDQARSQNQRVARVNDRAVPETAAPSVTR